MTGSVEDLLAGMRSLLVAIDNAAVSATRAQADAQQAQGRYQQAATGTAHPVLVRAVAAARTAAEKAGRTARLLAKSADAYTAYVNKIAPGAAGAMRPVPGAMPDGGELTETHSREPKWRRLVNKVKETESADDGIENFKKMANDGQAALPGGTVAPVRPPMAVLGPATNEGPQVGDALIAGAALALLVMRGSEVAVNIKRRYLKRRHGKDEGS